MIEETYCPACGKRNYYNHWCKDYMCVNIECGKNYSRDVFKKLNDMKNEGLDISLCNDPDFNIFQINFIEKILREEKERGLLSGTLAKYFSDPKLSDKQQDAIWLGLYFEKMFNLNPGEIVGSYANSNIPADEMKVLFKQGYYNYYLRSININPDSADLMVVTGERKSPEEILARREEINQRMDEIRQEQLKRHKPVRRALFPFRK